MTARLLCACFLLLAAWAPAAPGQVPVLRVELGGEVRTIEPAPHRAYAAFPASLLAPVGARTSVRGDAAELVLAADTIRFEALSPFFRARGATHQLVRPVYVQGGELYLPHQFFVEWLPTAFPKYFALEEGRLVFASLPGATAMAPAPAASRIVVIDPGHGGADPGEVGTGGVREKDVTLAVARRLERVLRERGYEVHLTRTTDTLVALADRPRLANEWRAGRPGAIFVSLHANSGPPSAQGFETFFLSEARTDDERRVAEMENAAVKFEAPGTPARIRELDSILQDLRNDFYLRASNDLAETIQRRMGRFHPGPDRGVKQAGFLVLVGALMPAVLVELAFVTNPGEAVLLASDDFQERLGRGLADAIDEFFEMHEYSWAPTAADAP